MCKLHIIRFIIIVPEMCKTCNCIDCDFERYESKYSYYCERRHLEGIPRDDLYQEYRNISSSTLEEQKLIALHFNENNLSEISAGDFDGMPMVTNLYLQDNQIRNIQDSAFAIMSKLITLDLDRNQLTIITASAFTGLSRLKELRLISNKIRHIATRSFLQLVSLRVLLLERNNLTQLSGHMFFGLDNLAELTLGDNNIGHITGRPFASLSNLKSVKLQNNNLSQLQTDTFIGLESLDKIDLNNNRIVHISNGAFNTPLSVRSIDLSGNRMERIPRALFGHIRNLSFIGLANNNIREISPRAFIGTHTIHGINLANNRLETIRLHTFTHLRLLDYVDLRGNPLGCESLVNIPSQIPRRYLPRCSANTKQYSQYIYIAIIISVALVGVSWTLLHAAFWWNRYRAILRSNLQTIDDSTEHDIGEADSIILPTKTCRTGLFDEERNLLQPNHLVSRRIPSMASVSETEASFTL